MAGPAGEPLYDRIGIGYSAVRTADARIEARTHAALGAASTVLNVGAGSGSYEPSDRQVVAVEPAEAMIAQRPVGTTSVVRAVAERLPFPDGCFEAAMGVLTVHHWPDPLAGLGELRRVTRGPVAVLTFDKEVHDAPWLIDDYLPGAVDLDGDVLTSTEIVTALGGGRVETVPVPHDCVDGFAHAWWRRPAAYLDPAVRAGISCIARLPADEVDAAMARLARDLEDGTWHDRHGHLLSLGEIDAGYRLAVSPGGSA
jgi:SAM-dependent methyltransferase